MSKHRFDHAAAKEYFVSLPPQERSSQAVADHFSVSRRTVDKWRKLDGWNDAAEKADVKTADELARRGAKSRVQRALQDARIRDLAAQRVESRLGEGDVADDFVARVLADADKRVRLNEGEATDHVAVAQVQAGFRESLSAAAGLLGELVGRALVGDELVRVFRQELPGRVQERLALIGGDDG